MNRAGSPVSCPCNWTKSNSRNITRSFISNTLNFPEYSSLLIDRIDKIPMHSLFSRNNLMLSVLPRCIRIVRSDNFMLCLCKAVINTSNVPEPLSRSTRGNFFQFIQSYLIIIHPLTMSMDDSHQLILQKRSIFQIRLPGISLYQCQIYTMFLQCLFHLRGVPAEK